VSRLHTCKVPTSLDRLAHAATSPTLRKFQRGCQERFCNYRQTNDQPHLAQWKELLRHLLEEYRHARFGSRRCPGSFHCSVRGHYSRVEGRHGRHASVLSLFGTCGDVDLDSRSLGSNGMLLKIAMALVRFLFVNRFQGSFRGRRKLSPFVGTETTQCSCQRPPCAFT
jgi:hypothetical protein